MRWAWVAVVALVWTTTAHAQGGIPGRVFVKDSNGDVWYVGAAGNRAQVALYQTSDDELAALPILDGWFAARPNGTGVGFSVGPKPDYATAQIAPTATPAAEEPIKLSGERQQNTRPFDLRGGTYVVTWDIRQPKGSEAACYASASLVRVEGKRSVESLFNLAVNRGDKPVNGETMVYGVTGGQHYLSVNGSCAWSVTIGPP